ncbi:alpha/beta hydrolase [Actinomadura terrae]|uniref:alpha/beta hydrolase n=1 Tax=Actinomadura terrae TaxID=604353 RepID=UPI001FA72519|nr:alpha/beta hydrolase [Actinomadura terrae]
MQRAVMMAAGLALVAAAVPVISQPARAAQAAPPRTIAWTKCGDDGKAECATLRLPVDWARPDGPSFGLAIARRKAKDPDARVGTLVFGPGGPGDSGVQRVTKLKGGIDRFSERLQNRFDIVSFDPRGIGGSHPVTCSADLLAARPSPVIKSQKEFDATLAYNKRLREDCRMRTGSLYDHADTLSTVRDVDAIRAALGEAQLNFHGSSYGTLLGEMYAETFPKRFRTMVLESVDDHSLRDTRRFLNSEMAAAQDSFDQFVAWCDRTTDCALHGRDVRWCDRTTDCALHGRDVRAVWRGLRERAARGTLPDPQSPGSALPEFALVVVAYKAFYGPDWAELASKLAALDATPNASPGASRTTRRAEPQPTGTDPFTAQFCSDWSLPVRGYGEYAKIIRGTEKIAPDMNQARPVMAVSACLGWPGPVNNPQHRLRVKGSAPILLTNAVHDPATPYSWARSVARQLGKAGTLLTYEGSGHGSYNRGPCMQDKIDQYLITGQRPAQGTTCPAV